MKLDVQFAFHVKNASDLFLQRPNHPLGPKYSSWAAMQGSFPDLDSKCQDTFSKGGIPAAFPLWSETPSVQTGTEQASRLKRADCGSTRTQLVLHLPTPEKLCDQRGRNQKLTIVWFKGTKYQRGPGHSQ